jgi:hypothetical protein
VRSVGVCGLCVCVGGVGGGGGGAVKVKFCHVLHKYSLSGEECEG